jgi:hypothetical protein
MMLRRKHSAPQTPELSVKIGDTEIRIPYRPDQSTTVRGGLPILPRRLLKLLHLA